MIKRIVVIILAAALAAASGCAAAAPAAIWADNGYWPQGGWRTSLPEEQGMDSQILADMINSINVSGKSIDSVTIIRNGYLVSETYFYPYQKGYRHALNSDTKSLLSALVGIAIGEGKIKSVDDKVLDYFPDAEIANVDESKKAMTIRDLLTMRIGLDWQQEGNASTSEMLQSPDWTMYTLGLPMKEQPGKAWNYCNGAANVMSAIIGKATGMTAEEYADEKLAPLGMDIFWSSAPEGASAGYSGIYMTPGDMAKLGYLYLSGGEWDGQQVIPQSWAEESTKQQAEADWTPLFPGYGYMWWTCRFGGFAALGFGGNYIFAVPEKNLVVVITGGIFDNDSLFYPGELMEDYIIPSIKSDSALEPNKAAQSALRKAASAVGEPQAEPALSLPALASEISGKPIELSNENGAVTLTLTFEGGSEFTVDAGGTTKKAGLGGVYRISEEWNTLGGTYPASHKALVGRWKYDNTLEVIERDMEDGFETVFTLCFDNGIVVLCADYSLGFKVFFTGKYPM